MDKKNTNDMFDVTMGSYDGAETCELVGHVLKPETTKRNHRNDRNKRNERNGRNETTETSKSIIK